MFDIITPDLITGQTAAASEAISIVSDCLDNFGNLWQHYEIHLSHSRSTVPPSTKLYVFLTPFP